MTDDANSREAIAFALRLLSLRNHSRHELAGKLMKKGYGHDAVEAAMDYLAEKRLVDDEAFGRELISSRSKRRPVGISAMRFELARKGVPDEIAGSLLREYDNASLCLAAAEKKLAALYRYDETIRKKKLEAFLRNRGFGWPVVRETIERLFHNRPS